jgi:hypothetical protein
MRIILQLVLIGSMASAFPQTPDNKPDDSHIPPLHNECLTKPKTVATGDGIGYVSIENICSNSISARMCTNYSKTGWSCQLYPAILPHGSLKSNWNENVSGVVKDVKAWATDYAGGSHMNDYKNLPTVKEPNKTVYPR